MVNLQKTQKDNLRKNMLRKRNALPETFVGEMSRKVEELLLSQKEYALAEKIFIYHSVKGEISTLDIIRKSLDSGKTVALPLVGKKDEMDFFKIESLSSLKKGALGIPEPYGESERLTPCENTLIVTPGVVFDRFKNRIGMGKGYYDRYFSKYDNINFKKIGICYDFQITDKLPAENHDMPLDKIISEKGVIE